MLGRIATWLLFASLAFVMVTHEGTQWPLWIFWTGLVLAILSFGEYVLKARREVRFT
jgi:phosphatidylglycerophosphate synthase